MRIAGRGLCSAGRPLVNAQKATYAEQFQGMYAMMCGLCTAFLLAGFAQLGWVVATVLHLLPHTADWSVAHLSCIANYIWYVLLILTLVAVCLRCCGVASPSSKNRIWNWIWMVGALLFAGNLVLATEILDASSIKSAGFKSSAPFFAATVVLWFLADRCYVFYEKFARLFAVAIYRSFLALVKEKSAQPEDAPEH